MATHINAGAGVQVAAARAKVPQRTRKHILLLRPAALSSNSLVRSSGEKEGNFYREWDRKVTSTHGRKSGDSR